MSDSQKPALVELAKNNQVVVVADLDHTSDDTRQSIQAQLPAMSANGVKHLFLEFDPRNASVSDLISDNANYSELIKSAHGLGIQIHLMDDRSRQQERAARFPQEQAEILKNDPYVINQEGLIAGASNPDKMRAYLAEQTANHDADIAFRNVRMVENIADEMQRHPGEKAMVLVGGEHTFKINDVDEGLRAKGLQTSTAQIFAPDVGNGIVMSAGAADKPDITLRADTGEAISYKIPDTNTNQRVSKMPEGAEIPWANREPVSDRNHPAMLCALDAAKGLDCSWNHTVSQAPPIHISREETGKMASPSTQRQAASPEPDGPPR